VRTTWFYNSAPTCLTATLRRRYFVERTFQDAKSELGRAEFAARSYRAWEHHLASNAAALWFVAQTKLEWEGWRVWTRRGVSGRTTGKSAATCATDTGGGDAGR